MTANLVAHADWSVDPRKRWMTIARRSGSFWAVTAPVPVGDLSTVLARMRAQARGGPVVLGVDLPLGLPRAYAARYARAPDFPTFLRGLVRTADFFRVCATLDEILPDRPFYPLRGAAGMSRAAHALALGLSGPAQLSRDCDRATAERPAGAPLFWTLGANQSGKAAVSAWRDLLLPALAEPYPPKLWPFEGALLDLDCRNEIVIAETYPAEALRQLGLRLSGSKRRQADRARLCAPLHAAMAALDAVPDRGLSVAVADGFGPDAAGEDRFDSLLGLLCVLNVLAGNRPDDAPDDPWIRRWEGWVLGQTARPRGALDTSGSGCHSSVMTASSPAVRPCA
jgi:hypothetical protein